MKKKFNLLITIIFSIGIISGSVLLIFSASSASDNSMSLLAAIIIVFSCTLIGFRKSDPSILKKDMQIILNDERHIEIDKLSKASAYINYPKILNIIFLISLTISLINLKVQIIEQNFMMGFITALGLSEILLITIKIYFHSKINKKM